MDERRLLIICSAIFLIMLFLAYLSKEFAVSTNLVFLGIIVLIVPYSVHRFLEFKRMKKYEEGFPAFLRDMAESQRAGLSIIEAIRLASKSEYGALSKEIKKMNSQLSWNIPLENVLKDFSKRMKKSKIIVRSIMIMEQANKSGGNIEDTMDSLANNIEMIRDVQDEKNMLMNQQVMMMYAIFFIFLGITVALIKFLMPMLQTQTPITLGITKGFSPNPCFECINGGEGCIGCEAFFTISSMFSFGGREDPSAYYRSLFFTMIVVQGFFSGLIAGQIGSDSVIAGTKHSAIMLLSGVFIFIIVVKVGII